jgi:hypothetical protein
VTLFVCNPIWYVGPRGLSLPAFCFDPIGGGQLHFANPHAYNEIYNQKNKWDKDSAVYGAFDMDQSSACFIKYEHAKPRRDVLSPMFSRASILKTQDLLQERVSFFF